MLQSRHSVDGSKLTEKGEATQPLWITLALQKQKGFREQQATREERKQVREAKQAEKLCKETVSTLRSQCCGPELSSPPSHARSFLRCLPEVLFIEGREGEKLTAFKSGRNFFQQQILNLTWYYYAFRQALFGRI